MKQSMPCIDQIPSQYAPETGFKIVSVILFKLFRTATHQISYFINVTLLSKNKKNVERIKKQFYFDIAIKCLIAYREKMSGCQSTCLFTVIIIIISTGIFTFYLYH